MRVFFRIILLPVASFLALPTKQVAADSTATVLAAQEAEIAALLAHLPSWSISTALNASVGYNDNLLLSNVAEERSGFLRGGVEAVLLRAPQRGMDYFFFANGEQTQFLNGTTVHHETVAFVGGEWRFQIPDRLKFSLGVQGYHLDQIFDVSDFEAERAVTELTVFGATVGPTIRWYYRRWGWIEAQAVGKRETYRDGFNDNRQREGAFRLGWRPGTHFEGSFGAMARSRDFDHRPMYSAGGLPRDNTRLRMADREADLHFAVNWEAAGHWTLTTQASVSDHYDHGSGYFNYDERRLKLEIEWRAGDWLVVVTGNAKRLDFQVQTVGFGLEPPARLEDEYTAQLRVERKLSSRWTGFWEYHWERSRCNDPIASYRVNEGLLGARWSWEK